MEEFMLRTKDYSQLNWVKNTKKEMVTLINYFKGVKLANNKQFEECIEVMEKAIEIAPESLQNMKDKALRDLKNISGVLAVNKGNLFTSDKCRELIIKIGEISAKHGGNLANKDELEQAEITKLIYLAKSYNKDEKYVNAVKAVNEVLNIDSNNIEATVVKIDILIYINAAEYNITDEEWAHFAKMWMTSTIANMGIIVRLGMLIIAQDKKEKPLSRHMIKIYPELYSRLERYKTDMVAILAKDAKINDCEEYLTVVPKFAVDMILENKDKPTSPYLIPTIHLISNISAKGVKFDKSVCEIIEKLVHHKTTMPTSIACLDNLLKSSPFSLDNKTIIKLCGIVTGKESQLDTRTSAFG